MRRLNAVALILAVIAALVPTSFAATAQAQSSPADEPAREVEPVVMQGAQLPGWSRSAAVGRGDSLAEHRAQPTRDAHNGMLIVPPDARTGVPVDEVAAYRWDGAEFVEIPVQVDERFPYFLSNSRSDSFFGPVYSGTDEELTYEWDTEAWNMIAGECVKEYLPGEGPMEDPVLTLDDDDEVTFMASDAGLQAPAGAGPAGSGGERQEIRLSDPRTPGSAQYVYLFVQEGGSSFDAENGHVRYVRDPNADEWVDRGSWPSGHPENLGSSNTGYGPNLQGTVCDPDGTVRNSNDRFARDGVTVTTPTYRWYASGRWMVRSMQIRKPDGSDYGPDLIDRWKGRAFQQNPDSSISVVGFEDEQVNWEANSSLLGELAGPVRAIREIWGADSGTNVTKTETFYRDSIQYRYRVRVHPIPPDGLYTSWDYNQGIAACYFNESHPECIAVDGVNDDELNVDDVGGRPAYFDATDPRHSKPLANLNWEQVSGAGDSGSLVYMFEMKSAQSAENPAVVPYYRDDACLDDGTGDDPSPRKFPGEASTDPRVYPDGEPCFTQAPEGYEGAYRQGCFACHGVHYFFTNDTDNLGQPKPITEIDGAQWQWAVPTSAPTSVGDAYANTVKTPLIASASRQEISAGSSVSTNVACDPLDPAACLLPFPNDLFTVADTTTDTGRRVNFSPLAMPRTGTEFTEGGEGKPVDPTEWNRNDGFSPGSMVLTHVPGLDLHSTWGTEDRPHSGSAGAEPVINEPGYFDHRDHIADISLYAREDAPLVILNADTGERHPFWSELDSHPDAVEGGERLLMMRPAVNLEEGARYIVALRDLRTADGDVIEPGSEFAAYKSGSGTDAARQSHFDNDIFGPLGEAGIAKEDLYLAWDFTVASERNLAERVLHMRDKAFELLGDTDLADRIVEGAAPEFVIDSTENRTDTWTDSRGVSRSQAIRRVRGRVDVPNFMDRIQQTEAHFKAPGKQGIYYDIPVPGSRLLDLNRDGLPDQNPAEPTVRVPFVCDVPLNGEKNIPGFYGHGLLGDRDQINDFNKSPRRNGSFMGCAVDWWGMSTADIPTVATILADFSNFPSLPDRAQQGFLNFMIAGRAAVHPDGFATDPAFQQDGESLIKTADENDTYLVYDGNSQGGIMGGALVALSPDTSRGILGVLGMNYSTLLNRSVDWEGELKVEADLPPYSVPFYESYRDPVERQIVFDLMQMLWDRGEANGYAHHMTTDPYDNTPPHEVMLQAAFSDHQVANASAEVEARTIGAPLMTPDLAPGRHWALDPFIETATYPHRGSGLIYWDSGNATPPNANLPPTHDPIPNDDSNGDPHGHPRDERAASWQEAHFLLTGEMYDVCQGGFYLTDNNPVNGGNASCLEPDFAAGSQPPSPTPTPTPTPTEPEPTPTPTEVAPIATDVRFVDTASSGQYSDDATFKARLTQEDGTPLPGQTLRFELTTGEGTRDFTGQTDQDGVASVSATLIERPGNADLRVFYDGSETHEPDGDWMSFLIAKEDSTLTLEVKGKGSKRSLLAVLTDADSGIGIASRSIEFSADGDPICRPAPSTDTNGSASCDPPGKYQGGHRTYAADFREDDYYLAAAAQRST